MSAAPNGSKKKTIYIDVDEEITGIIDKVRSSSESIVALVLPKRATQLQSVVNMKLLKRTADQTDKKVVLITSEAKLLPLAGAAGLFVASNLQSRPYVPALPGEAPQGPVIDDEESSAPDDGKPVDPATPVGEAAGLSSDETDPIEIDNRSPEPEPAAAKGAGKKGKGAKDKSKKVPNFQKFRWRLFAGIAAGVALLLFVIWAIAFAPKAKITLRTESKEVNVTANFTADLQADSVDTSDKTLPATKKEVKKTESEKVAATGQRDVGTKASGNVSLRNCTDKAVTIPAGTGVSNGSLTFVTQAAVRLDEGEFSSPSSGGQCRSTGDHVGTASVVAQNNGEQYNLSSRAYTIAGFSGVIAQGDQMSGGTTKMVKIVSQTDVDNAKKRITDKQNSVVSELKEALEKEGYVGLVDSFSAGNPNLSATPAVNTEASDVVVSGDITYSMTGVKEDDLKKIVEEQAKGDIDTSKQKVLDYGFDEATFELGRKTANTTAVTVKTTIVVGPEIDQTALKQELAGKKKSDAEELLKSRPGVTEVKVETSPFWSGKIPGKESRVIFIIEQADGKQITP